MNNASPRRFPSVKSIVVTMLCIVAGFLVGQQQPPIRNTELTLNKLTITDANGKPRIVMSIDEDKPTIALMAKDGVQRLCLQVDRAGGMVEILDGQKTARVVIAHGEDGASSVVLKNAGGKAVGGIVESESGGGRLYISDKEGNRRVELATLKDDVAVLSVGARSGAAKTMIICKGNDPSMAMIDHKGIERFVLGTKMDGTVMRAIKDEEGRVRIIEAVDRKGSGYGLIDEKQETRASLSFTDAAPALKLFASDGLMKVYATVDGEKRGSIGLLDSERLGTVLSSRAIGIVDKNKVARVFLGSTVDDNPTIRLNGADGKPRLAFDLNQAGYVSEAFFDKKGEERLIVGTEANGIVKLKAKGIHGEAQASLNTIDDVTTFANMLVTEPMGKMTVEYLLDFKGGWRLKDSK